MWHLCCCKRESFWVRKAFLLVIILAIYNFPMFGKYSKREESSRPVVNVSTSSVERPQDGERQPKLSNAESSNNVKSGIKTYAFRMRRKEGSETSKMMTNRKKSFLEDQVVVMDDVWTEEQTAAQAKIFADRVAAVDAFCGQKAEKLPFLHNISDVHTNLRWVPKHKLVWCPVYKAGSTTWMTNLLLLAGINSTTSSLHRQVRELYSPPKDLEERQRLLDTSLRMLIVRHPLERLLSAYRDKMLRDNQFQKMSQHVKSKYSDPNARKDDPHPTFRQFLQYIRDNLKRFWNSEGKTRVNPHWQPVWWTCGPCQIKYDAIAHMETLMVDQEYIIRKAGLKDLAVNAHTHSSSLDSYNGTNQATRDYFSRIPKTLIEQVSDLYRHDFQLFGYTPKEFVEMGTN